MNSNLIKGLLIGALLTLTLPLFYLLFTNVILPSLWQENEPDGQSVNAVETSTNNAKDVSHYERFT